MANDCFYSLKAKGNAKDLTRLLNIPRNEDREYALSRIFSAELGKLKEDTILINGTVAWSVSSCMFDEEMFDEEISYIAQYGSKFRDSETLKRTTIDRLAKLLHIKVEIWSEEYEVGFQEHYIVNEYGEIELNESRKAYKEEVGEEGEDDYIVVGGFKNIYNYSF